MDVRRRRFMAAFGVGLTGFLTLACRPRPTPLVTCYVAPPETPVPTPQMTCYTVVPAVTPTTGVGDRPEWLAVRAPWLALDALAKAAADDERGPMERDRLIGEHRKALDVLVDTGQVDAGVAEDMQVAYAEAAFHVWRTNCNITCYMPAPYPEYGIESRADLTRQAEMLEEMATRSGIDPDTVAEARTAIERDITFLAMSDEEERALVDEIVKAAGESRDYPELTELGLKVPPESAEAARVLVELLIARQ